MYDFLIAVNNFNSLYRYNTRIKIIYRQLIRLFEHTFVYMNRNKEFSKSDSKAEFGGIRCDLR